jgi:hypothetical protein
MNVRGNSIRTFVALASLPLFGSACQLDQPNTTEASAAVSDNGAGSEIPAFYDGKLFTINLFELSDAAAAVIIAHNKGLNDIYASNDLDDPQDFTPVIDAIPTDGFNPLWHQFLIVFNAGFAPHQFTSDEQIDAAAAGPNPEITLVDTGEVYRCAVVGKKPR